jgi:penicillin-binding protein 1C
VLDRYLALAPFGGNLEGVRAASLAYFGKEPRKLTIGEAALLVALPQSPERAGPIVSRGGARGARPRARSRVARGVIPPRKRGGEARAVPRTAQTLSDARRRTPPKRPSPPIRRPCLKLSIDARLQAKLETLAREAPRVSVRSFRRRSSSSTMPAAKCARASAPPIISRRVARRRDRHVARAALAGLGAEAVHLCARLRERLAHPETVLFDRPARYGAYAPENFDLGYQGTVTARKALQMSLNLPAIELLADVGPANFLARLHGAGAEIALPKDTPIGLAIGLGGLGISLTDLARLYAGLARGGEAPALIERLDGAPPIDGPKRVTDPVAAFYVEDILRGAPPPASALSGRIAFKTGTSYGFATRWRSASTRARRSPSGSGGPTMARARPRRPTGRGADPVRRLRAAGARHRADPRAQGRAAASRQRRSAAAAAPFAQGCAQDHGRDRDAAAEDRLPPDGARIDLGLGGRATKRWR